MAIQLFFYIQNKQNAYQASKSKRLSFDPHLHTHIEIVLMRKGESLGVADSKQAIIRDGDLFISFPNQIHHYYDKTTLIDCDILIVSPDMCPEFSKIFKTKIPESPVMKNAINNTKIITAINTIMELNNDDEYNETQVRGSLLVLLSEFFRNVKLIDNISCDNNLVKNIINFCYENYDSDISLQSISESLHINRYYISHIFSQKLHTSFNDYINYLRIRKACEMLKSNDSPITEISYAVGYGSPRTFNRCFMKIKGITPKEYRNKAHKSKISK